MTASNVSSEASSYPLASLYVGDLHPDITEAMLYEKFSSVGPILSIRICRDMITCRSLGYAYINFQQPEDAELALTTMDLDLLRGRPMRIMRSQRDPTLRKSAVGNVFIRNLDKKIDNKALLNTFSTFGNILSCKIMTDKSGQSKGFGFVQFETQEAADKAIDQTDGTLLGKQKIHVVRSKTGAPRIFTNIFIKNFGDQLDEEKLRELCSIYGKISSLKVETDENGHSKGFAFCSYDNPEEAQAAVENLNGHALGDKQLYVGRFQTRNERLEEIKCKNDGPREQRMRKYQGMNVYIKNLDDTIDKKRLKKEFSKFGTITSAKVMSENGQSKGFGFVCFSTSDEAAKAVAEMNGVTIGSKAIYVDLAQRKKERHKYLIEQCKQRIATARLQSPPQLLFPNGMTRMVPYTPTLMSQTQPRNLFVPPTMPFYQQFPVPWPVPAATGAMTPQTYAQMFGRQIPPLMMQRGPVPSHVGVQSQYPFTRQTIPPNYPHALSSSIVIPSQEPLTPAALANATPQEQRQMLGRRLFPLIHQMQPNLANKITGMLLETNQTELLLLLESRELLKAKVEETIAVLQAQHAKQLYAARLAATNSSATRNMSPNNHQTVSTLPIVLSQEPLTPAALARATPQEQKQMLGERLFPLIQQMQPALAGRITGMLLEISNAELLHMLESRELLKTKVEEVVAVLQAYQTKPSSVAQQTVTTSAT